MIKPNLNKFQTYFFDLDGTLYLGKKIISGADKLVEKLNDMHKDVYALTNNCILHIDEYFQKLQNMGIKIKKENVINSTTTVIDWLKKSSYSKAKLHVHGTKSMERQIIEAGFEVSSNIIDAKFIVLGNKTDLSWNTLTDMAVEIQKGKEYVVSNSDLRLPLGNDLYGVDTGTTWQLIETISKKSPLAVLGKTFSGVLKPYIKGEAIFFGDRIYTDMRSAKLAKINNCLVLSGEATLNDYEKHKDEIDYFVNSVNDLV